MHVNDVKLAGNIFYTVLDGYSEEEKMAILAPDKPLLT